MTTFDWQHRFNSDAQMQHRPGGAAWRALLSEVDANLAAQENLAAWIAEQDEALGRARDYLSYLRAVHADLARALDLLDG